MLLLDSNHFKQFILKFGLLTFIDKLILEIEANFRNWQQFDKSPRHATAYQNGIIELMPCSNQELYSFKYVNGHPNNPQNKIPSILALGLLADTNTGLPLIASEMTFLTAIRTACTSAIATKYGSSQDSKNIGIIGCGSQSEFQVLAINQVRNCHSIYYFDKDPQAMTKFARNLNSKKFKLVQCDSARMVAENSEILVTNTGYKGRQSVIEDLANVQLLLAIGGDCPGKTELPLKVLKQADEIWVEYLEQTKIEGEIQNLTDLSKVKQLKDIIQNNYQHSNQKQIIFDGVGFALEDFSALNILYKLIKSEDVPRHNIFPEPADPKDLFGELYAK